MLLKNKKNLILISFIAVLAICVFSFYWLSKDNNKAGQPVIGELRDQETADDNRKQTFIENNDENRNDNSSTTPNTANKVEVAAEKGQNNTVTIFSKIYEPSAIKCSLEITNGDKVYKKEATVIYQTDYSICAGYSVPVADLGIGKWIIKLYVSTPSNTLSATTQLEVN